MSDVDDAITAARSSWSRIVDVGPERSDSLIFRRRRRGGIVARRLKRIAAAVIFLLGLAFVTGIVLPTGIGIMGVFLTIVAIVAATVTIAAWPAADRAPPRPDVLREVDIKALPARTERWLEAQRPALPAPARTMVDRIGMRLEALTPQLAGLEDGTEPAFEVRRLVGEQLPAFVNDYARVPETLRTTPRNGKTPDAELIDGLKLIEQEIGKMTQRLAQTDLDALQTRGRFLEMKYRDEGAGS